MFQSQEQHFNKKQSLQNTSGENKEAHPKDETSIDSLSIYEELSSNEALASVSGGADGALGNSNHQESAYHPLRREMNPLEPSQLRARVSALTKPMP